MWIKLSAISFIIIQCFVETYNVKKWQWKADERDYDNEKKKKEENINSLWMRDKMKLKFPPSE